MKPENQTTKISVAKKKYFRNGGHNGVPQHPKPVAISTQPHKPAKAKPKQSK